MIIELVIKNWLSFRDETVFSMVTQGEKRLLNRVPQIRSKPVLNVNPVAVLYGGNASGKSNLLSFFAFLKLLVLYPIHEQEQEIPLQQYVLSKSSSKNPTLVDFTFLTADNHIFTLHLLLEKDRILEESLSMEDGLSQMRMLYKREGNVVSLLDDELKNNEKAKAFKEIIRQNQLYLAIASPEVKLLESARRWFSRQLKVIDIDAILSRSGHWYIDDNKREKIGELLEKLDTGIQKLKLFEDNKDNVSSKIYDEIKNDLANSDVSTVEVRKGKTRIYISKQKEKILFQRLMSFHKSEDGDKLFDLEMEADGTIRLLDILPVFLDLEDASLKPVYIMDEFGRNWHYLLSKKLLTSYLASCSKTSRSQLIFSTHDLMMMDQNLFRRSEMFITERAQDGASSVSSLNISGLRYDKDIRKIYLQGKLGGIPCLRHYGLLSD